MLSTCKYESGIHRKREGIGTEEIAYIFLYMMHENWTSPTLHHHHLNPISLDSTNMNKFLIILASVGTPCLSYKIDQLD